MRRPDIAELIEDLEGLRERGGSDTDRAIVRTLGRFCRVLESLAAENDDLRKRLQALERAHGLVCG